MKRIHRRASCAILALLLLSCEPIETAGGGEDTTVPIESIYSIGKNTVEINFGKDMKITDAADMTHYSNFAVCFTAYPKNTVSRKMQGESVTLTNKRLIITMSSSDEPPASLAPGPDSVEWYLDFKQDDANYIIESGIDGRKLESFYDRHITFNPGALTASIAGLTAEKNELTLTFNRVLEKTVNRPGYIDLSHDFKLRIDGTSVVPFAIRTEDGAVFIIEWNNTPLKSGTLVEIEFNSNNQIKDTLGQSIPSDKLIITNTVP